MILGLGRLMKSGTSRVTMSPADARKACWLCSGSWPRLIRPISLKDSLAATGLLLNAPQVKPFDLAREVYEKAPTNAAYVSTYAYSLYVQEKREEALQVIEKLPPADLEKPSIAAYYGVFLQAAGQSDKARKYLDLTSKATLLPEERALVEKARSL